MTEVLAAVPSPMQLRAMLEEMVFADLHGPVGGEAEEIDEPSVRERYLVGMLAPKRQELSPEEFDELPQGGTGTVEEGTTDYTAPTAKTMFPSSFGLTFCVDVEAKELQVIARWGHYARERSETLTTPTGEKRLVWKRSQRQGVSKPIPLQVGRVTWTPDADFPEVQVQGIIRKRDHFWSVTLFLVNGQEEPKKLRDTAWLFQPELIVQSPDGKPVFHSRPQQRDPGKADPVTFAEDQELAMLYRNHVEFGVGHGVSVHAELATEVTEVTEAQGPVVSVSSVTSVANGPRAFRLSTKVVPAYDVPQTTPPTSADFPKLAGLVLDMKELGQTPTAEFDKKLLPSAGSHPVRAVRVEAGPVSAGPQPVRSPHWQ